MARNVKCTAAPARMSRNIWPIGVSVISSCIVRSPAVNTAARMQHACMQRGGPRLVAGDVLPDNDDEGAVADEAQRDFLISGKLLRPRNKLLDRLANGKRQEYGEQQFDEQVDGVQRDVPGG